MFHKTFIKTDRACGATTALMNALFEELEQNPGSFGLYLAPYGEVSHYVGSVRDRLADQVSRNTVCLPNLSVLKFAVCREEQPCSLNTLCGINFNAVASCETAFDVVAIEEYNYLPQAVVNRVLAIETHRPSSKLFRTYAFDRTDEEVIVLFREPQQPEKWGGAKSSITVRPVEPAFAKERKTILAKHV